MEIGEPGQVVDRRWLIGAGRLRGHRHPAETCSGGAGQFDPMGDFQAEAKTSNAGIIEQCFRPGARHEHGPPVRWGEEARQ